MWQVLNLTSTTTPISRMLSLSLPQHLNTSTYQTITRNKDLRQEDIEGSVKSSLSKYALTVATLLGLALETEILTQTMSSLAPPSPTALRSLERYTNGCKTVGRTYIRDRMRDCCLMERMLILWPKRGRHSLGEGRWFLILNRLVLDRLL